MVFASSVLFKSSPLRQVTWCFTSGIRHQLIGFASASRINGFGSNSILPCTQSSQVCRKHQLLSLSTISWTHSKYFANTAQSLQFVFFSCSLECCARPCEIFTTSTYCDQNKGKRWLIQQLDCLENGRWILF